MKAVFADSFYYLALVNANDAAHDRAVRLSETLTGSVVTTAWVLTEVADALTAPDERPGFLRLLATLRDDPEVTIVPPDEELFEAGIDLYSRRSDKQWSLTDCISFVVMEDMALVEALTADRRFEQAGFRALLRQSDCG
jgi:predicted nucleic acid-binding protein